MNRTNRSNFTSLSFTVQDDLISEASVSTYIADRKFDKNPFSKNYEIKGLDKNNNSVNQQYLASNRKLTEKLQQKAHNDAYKQLNNDIYNPFQHKLQNTFLPKQQNLYQKEKQRQIQFLKRKQDEELNNNRNYTILFNNQQNSQSQKKNNTLKLAANSVLQNGQDGFNIQDYYNKNIKKRRENMKQIEQENISENMEDQNLDKQISFKGISSKKIQKNSVNIHLKQNNKTNKTPYNATDNRKINSKPQIPATNSAKEISLPNKKTQQKNTSIQKPSTSKRIKKPINNFISTNKQGKVNPSSNKQIPKNIPPPQKGNKKSLSTSTNQTKNKYSEVYEGADRNLVEQIQNQIAQQTCIKFQDIAQLQNAKSLLQQAVVLPRIMPQFFKGIRKAMKGILMFGPPGTGKTLLAKAVANDNMFFNVSASSLASKWKGQSQKMVRILFQMARYHSPSIIFFDEIDAIASKRTQNEHESSRKVKTQLLVQMDGVQSSQHQVFVLAATNRPWDLDQALRRRLQKRIYIPLPQKQGRKKMFQLNLKQIKLHEKLNWERIVRQTEGYSGADISNVCRDAAYMPMRRMLAKVGIKKMGQINEKQLLDQELSQKDILESIKNNKPSVNLDDLKKYDKWMKQFGSQ